MTGAARHPAQLDVGRLLAATDDPRAAERMAAPGRANRPGMLMPGFRSRTAPSGASARLAPARLANLISLWALASKARPAPRDRIRP